MRPFPLRLTTITRLATTIRPSSADQRRRARSDWRWVEWGALAPAISVLAIMVSTMTAYVASEHTGLDTACMPTTQTVTTFFSGIRTILGSRIACNRSRANIVQWTLVAADEVIE